MLEKLVVRLLGEGSSYRKMMDSATAQAQRFEKTVNKMGKTLSNIGASTTRIGRAMTLAFTLPALAAGGGAVKAFADFDQKMVESTSIMKVTEDQIASMRNQALQLAATGEVLQTPTQMAEAYFFLASAGMDATDAMASMPRVAAFATAGAFDMALATDLLTDAQSALGLNLGTTEQKMAGLVRISDVLVKANTLSNATVQQFSEALTNDAGPSLKTFGKTVEEGTAVLAAYADQGIKGQVAGSQLARVTRLLASSAIKNAKAHEKLGFSVFDNNGKMRNYADIIGQLERITGTMTDEMRTATLEQLGFQARVQNAILPLIGLSDQIAEYQTKLESAGGTTEMVATKQMASFSNQLKVTKNQTLALAIGIGEALSPTILRFNQYLSQLVKWFTNLEPRFQQIIALVAVAAIVAGPLLIVVGQLTTAFGTLLSVIGPVIGAITAFINPIVLAIVVVAGLIAVSRSLLGSWSEVGRVFTAVADLIVDSTIFALRVTHRSWMIFMGWFVRRIREVFTQDFVRAVVEGIKMAAEKLFAFGEWAMQKLRAIFTGSESGSLADFFGQITGDLKEGYTTEDLLGSLAGVVAQERANFAGLRQGDRVLTPEQSTKIGNLVAPIKDKISGDKDETTAIMKQVAEQGKEMLDIARQNLEKDGPLALPLNLDGV